jgi:hypothetical protein
VVASANDANDVFVRLKPIRRSGHKRIKIVASLMLWPYVRLARSLVVLALHRTKEIATNQHGSVKFLRFVEMLL